MEILPLIFLLLAYSIGSIMLFVLLVCYKRKIEFLETVLLGISFLLLVIFATVNTALNLVGLANLDTIHVFLLLSMVLVGVTTPLNVFKERIVTIKPAIKTGLIAFSGLLFVAVILGHFFDFIPVVEPIVSLFMLGTVVYSMLIIRKNPPIERYKYREKIERITALTCLIVLPLSLALDFLPQQFPILQWEGFQPLKLTLPLLFIFIAGGKVLDDIKRLSLFNPSSTTTGISVDQMSRYNFTKRETEIVGLLVKGATYNQISEALFISLPTVKTHVSNIYKKAEVNNKVALINSLTS